GKKAPGKRAPAKPTKGIKAEAKKTDPPAAPAPRQAALPDTNGETRFAAADDAAAQARSVVDTAGDTLGRAVSRVPGTSGRIPIVVAVAVALLAILLVRRLLSED
ncbi:MAG: nucleoid-structuring protein H-NS, partial [Mycobacterium sp.]|nr:nucleoid-structuring protein H-NS [Mycobacterium sp.]